MVLMVPQVLQILNWLLKLRLNINKLKVVRLFQLALTKAVREILPPVVNRTNAVALVTTKSLVLKDFSLEVDDLKLRKVYINTVRQLSEALTLASCKDLLRESVQLNLHQYIQSLGQQLEPAILEELPRAINDNLDLACSIIQKAATEKSVQDLDELMLPAIALRRQFRDSSRPDQAFCDTQYASRYAMSLPDPLGIKAGGITAKQLSVYEEFGKNKYSAVANQGQGGNQFANVPGAQPSVPAMATPTNMNVNIAQAQQPGVIDQQRALGAVAQPTQLLEERTLEQTLVMLQQLTEGLLKAINDTPDKEIKLRDTTPENPIRVLPN
ncbi:unnamed protein product [Ambrosiozyma monospora]|uniref:Unnamed protein product n=1 Tax=Ambrosiozyma monospora TaxID=43982 RepID=A0ACB5TR38_AMBMO|nr:unnamed protein product [Ambrosiozyma monospora]